MRILGWDKLGRGKLGAGRDARLHTHERASALAGARFVLRCPAGDAVTFAVAHLVVEGFVAREDNLEARLREMGSPWLARAAEIGDAKGSWAKGLMADLIEDTPWTSSTDFNAGSAPRS